MLAVAGYVFFLASNATNVAGGSDSSGYLNSARLLASGRLQEKLRAPAEFGALAGFDRNIFTPFGFRPCLDHLTLSPTYPVGLPLHLAAAIKLAGWQVGPFLVEIVGALAALGLVYLIARELRVGRSLAAAGTIVLGSCPVFIFTSIQPLTDTLATTWTLACVYTALRGRHHGGWAAACGGAFAVAVLVRLTNSVLLPALVVFLGLNWRRLALFVAGGIPGALWFVYYNQTLYGGVLRSGYGAIHVTFDTVHIPGALVDFACWLAVLLPAIVLVLPMALLLLREFRGRQLVGLALWFWAVVGFFASVSFSHESWWSLRYILPAMPALILAALLGLEALARCLALPYRHTFLVAAAASLALWSVASSVFWTRKLGIFHSQGHEQAYADAARAARDTFPKGALIVCSATSGALYYYTDLPILRSDLIEAPRFARFAADAHAAGRPICALVFDGEETEVLHENCPGDWRRLATVRNLGLWQHVAAAPLPP